MSDPVHPYATPPLDDSVPAPEYASRMASRLVVVFVAAVLSIAAWRTFLRIGIARGVLLDEVGELSRTGYLVADTGLYWSIAITLLAWFFAFRLLPDTPTATEAVSAA